ncbi:MAG: peptidase S41 [Idiomarina sp.]|uniref:S41 family peptidase n=1 Tax=Idiomarina sp. TaxID=1874361 RepID=UPI000C69EE5F|nr:S41 family peptidase [Idiomarina sp.]MBT42394.1 peptidase S41 [Idiomarina sp.]
MTINKSIISVAIAMSLSACGGSSGGDSANTGGSDNSDYATCSVADQNQRFFDYMKDDYFWASQLPEQVDPEAFDDVYELLEELRVPEDSYSYILTEEEYESLFVTAEYAGFGFSQQQVSASEIKLRLVYRDSPAWEAGMRRADSIIAIDGVPTSDLLSNGSYNDALGEPEVGVTREITWRKPSGEEMTASISKDTVETNTVMGAQVWSLDQRAIGYFTLDSFINRTGADLNEAFDQFASANVEELVIDVRYNGGGLIRYANQAATQTAGTNVQGKTFVEYRFNEQNSNQNEAVPFGLVDGVEQLDLDSVIVLTTGASCSSSELIINSLKPHVDVTVIGNRTCGKPVGQVPEQLCDKVTFAINFETVNSAGEGRYFDGIAPTCRVTDRIVADWGSSDDPLTGAALSYLENGQCSTTSASNELAEGAGFTPQTPVFYNLKQKRASLQ